MRNLNSSHFLVYESGFPLHIFSISSIFQVLLEFRGRDGLFLLNSNMDFIFTIVCYLKIPINKLDPDSFSEIRLHRVFSFINFIYLPLNTFYYSVPRFRKEHWEYCIPWTVMELFKKELLGLWQNYITGQFDSTNHSDTGYLGYRLFDGIDIFLRIASFAFYLVHMFWI